MNEELLELAKDWSVEQFDSYIEKLENRIKNARELISDIKMMRKVLKRKMVRKTYDNGVRGGK